jgi:DNA-binding CsgD family transcriptional regulator
MDGFQVKEAADRLYISPQTAKNHLLNVRTAPGARNTLHAVILAMRRGETTMRQLALADRSTDRNH